MYSAEQYLEAALKLQDAQSINHVTSDNRITTPWIEQSKWIKEDYMDFAERYADYVCNYEKTH